MASILPSRPRQFGPRKSFAIVASQYHPTLVKGLIDHARNEFEVIGPGTAVHLYEVPGAFEIPLVVQEVAAKGGVDAIVALGVIIQGATAHADFIGRAVTESLQRIALNNRLPVIHEVLLLQNEDQARQRCLEEEINRGTEAARVAVRMAQIMGEIVRR
jgi:6,7-dimethyl-8-ribityllumazine synthase